MALKGRSHCLDSGFRRNDVHVPPFVIPAKAGIQVFHRDLLRYYIYYFLLIKRALIL